MDKWHRVLKTVLVCVGTWEQLPAPNYINCFEMIILSLHSPPQPEKL